VPARRWFGELWWIVALPLSLAVTAWIVFVGEGIDAYYRSRLVDMVHGTAYRPYVYRVLVPGLARAGSAVMPESLSGALTSVFQSWQGRPSTWPPPHAADYVLVISIMAASVVGFAVAVREFSRTMFSAPPRVHAWIALAAVGCLPLTFGPFSRQIYDFGTLCVFTWSLVLMAQRRWTAFAIAFALSCLNKESSILLALVYLVYVSRSATGLSKAGATALFVYQLIVFALIRAAVVYAFRDNPGDTVEIHLFGHNQYVLLHPAEMSKRLPLLIAAAALGAWGWRDKPLFLRQAFMVLGPALVLIGATVGMVDEIRAYYEIYAVIVLMAAHTILRAMGVPVGAANSTRSAAGAPAWSC
jgi:hypothetical protein